MKKLFLFLTLLSLVFSGAVSAVEYVTLNFAKQSINTDPTDLIQCVGIQDSWRQKTIRGIINSNGEQKKIHPLPITNSSALYAL